MWRFTDIPFALRSYVNCQYPLEPARRTKITLRPSVNIKYWISAVPRSSRTQGVLSLRLCELTPRADRQAETLISGNVKRDATRGKRVNTRICKNCNFGAERKWSSPRKPYRKNYVADQILRRRADLQPVSFTKASVLGVARIRTGAPCSRDSCGWP